MKLASQIKTDMAPGGDSISPDTAFRVAASYPGASQSPSPGLLRAASQHSPRTSSSRPAALSSAGPSLIAIDSHAPGRGNL